MRPTSTSTTTSKEAASLGADRPECRVEVCDTEKVPPTPEKLEGCRVEVGREFDVYPCGLANVALFGGSDLRSTELAQERIVFRKNNLVRKNGQEPGISDREQTRTRCPPVTNDPIIVKRIVRVWFSDFGERS